LEWGGLGGGLQDLPGAPLRVHAADEQTPLGVRQCDDIAAEVVFPLVRAERVGGLLEIEPVRLGCPDQVLGRALGKGWDQVEVAADGHGGQDYARGPTHSV
jgi:hypothetical protein